MPGRMAERRLDYRCARCGDYLTAGDLIEHKDPLKPWKHKVDVPASRPSITHLCGPVEHVVKR